MSSLILHAHPLSSYCQKVSIALDELGVEVETRLLDLGNPDARAALLALWPTGKMPVLVDDGRPVAESSIIVEHVQQHHAAAGRRLIPQDVDQALDVRLWDRLFDGCVMTPMQALTADLLRPPEQRDATGTAQARQALAKAYGWLERRLQGRTWIAAADFSLADCAAAPSLFYALAYVPLPPGHEQLGAYVERLLARASVARAIDAARPWFEYFPGRSGLERRFYDPGGA